MSKKPVTPTTSPRPTSTILSFIVFARDLPMRDRGLIGSTVQDPYIRWSHRDNSQSDPNEWNVGLSTKYRVNEPNPDYFDTVFDFEWKQGTGQVWRFEVLDFDIMNKDDFLGTVEVNVDDYVAKRKQSFQTKFKGILKGSLLINRVNMIKFWLSARDLNKLDAFDGKSDPYVECYWTSKKGGPETLFAKTETIKNVENCEWEFPIEFPIYQAGADQGWVFKVFDKDSLSRSDAIGEAYISVDEFVKSKLACILSLSDKEGNDSKLIVTPILSYIINKSCISNKLLKR